MTKENKSQEFRLKNLEEKKNYFIKEIDKDKLMSTKHKKVCMTLNYIEHFIILVSAVIECISNFAFAFLLCILIEITRSAVGLKTCAITAAIKMHKEIIEKGMNKHGKMVLLTKTKLNTIEILISQALVD